MKATINIIVLLLFFSCSVQGQYISYVYEYIPAPGQQINALPWGQPSSANSILGGIDGSLSLGAFGGYVIFAFDEPVENHPENPYGVDFTLFGNPMIDAAEPGQIYVSKDLNHNGVPDDKWFLIAGSDHWFPSSIENYRVNYVNPGGAEDVFWYDDQGQDGYIFTNSIHEQPYYPGADSFPDIPSMQYNLNGFSIKGAIDGSNIAFVKSAQRMFGYADNHLRGSPPYTLPDNPYTVEKENAGGDAIDIAWAVNEYGNYVDLDMIHFVKVQTGLMGDLGWLGEVSTEITGAVDTEPDASVSGQMDVIVIRDLPPIIDSSFFQLESYVFQSGIYMPGTAVDWETNVDWADINYSGLMTVDQSGEFEITASLLSNPDIQTTVSCKVELPAAIHEFSNARIQIFPNPAGDHISISEANGALISIFNTRGEILMERKSYSVEEKINIGELSPGIYLLRVSTEKYSSTLKLIKR